MMNNHKKPSDRPPAIFKSRGTIKIDHYREGLDDCKSVVAGAILTAVAYFAMVCLGLRMKLWVLARHVMGASRRLFGIPDFLFYGIDDGICEYLFGFQKGLQGFHHQWLEESAQLGLFDP